MGDIVVVDLKTMTVASRHKIGTDPFGGGLKMGRKSTSQN